MIQENGAETNKTIRVCPNFIINLLEVNMTKSHKIDKQEILSQLSKEGVTNLEQFADFLVKKSHSENDPNGPVTNGVIIYSHGFVTH